MTKLFTPFQLKDLKLDNRIVMAPMCQYFVHEKNGIPTSWHYVHYLTRAIGGVGLILIEMTNVDPAGCITNNDLGLWADNQIPAFQRIVDGIHSFQRKVGVQIGHAGRKAQDARPSVAPSAIAFEQEGYSTPHELSLAEVRKIITQFAAAVRRAVAAGMDTIELHGAHGYLIHQFHSPLTNKRKDAYGQDLSLFGVEIIQAVKREMPAGMPLIMRISAREYVEGGYDIQHAIAICRDYQQAGVDLFHISSGGEAPLGKHKPGKHPGFQVSLATLIRQALNVPVIAVGRLDDFHLADEILTKQEADLIAIGRGLLRDPYWPVHAQVALKEEDHDLIPAPYVRGY